MKSLEDTLEVSGDVELGTFDSSHIVERSIEFLSAGEIYQSALEEVYIFQHLGAQMSTPLSMVYIYIYIHRRCVYIPFSNSVLRSMASTSNPWTVPQKDQLGKY